MLFGMGSSAKKTTTQNAASENSIDVSEADFETQVVKQSMLRPVLVDFWAPWCGPCKQLGPTLEKAVNAANGQVLLAKINVDENQRLAQMFRVQSIPMVVALYKGQPVTAFSGARSQTEIEQLIAQLIALHKQQPQAPESMDIPQLLKDAAAFLAEQNLDEAQTLYAAILEQDENNAQAYIGFTRVIMAKGLLDDVQDLINQAPDTIAKDPQFKSIQTALDLAKSAPAGSLSDLEQKAAANPDDLAQQFDLAMAYFAAAQKDVIHKENAVDQLMKIIRSSRATKNTAEEEKARQQLLKFFEAWGHTDPTTIAGRRKLSAILFS